MRAHILLAATLLIPSATAAPVTAWFTDAAIPGATRASKPAGLSGDSPGAYGRGFRPVSDAARVEWPSMSRDQGMVSFWVKPDWNGADGQRHVLLAAGDDRNGFLVEKSAKGFLRFVMASPEKTTVARADVSRWKAGEWHHVAAAWFHHNGKPAGLPLWIDRVAADGPVAAGCTFLDPDGMQDRIVRVGDGATRAVIDELILRDGLDAEGPHGMKAVVYRDWFRTAPFDAIRINHEPLRVPSDRRAVAGFQKQFGLEARRNGRWEPITDHVVRYGPWAEFDAKPFITWSVSDATVAAIDADGRLSAKKPGTCTLTASFRGMKATYPLGVIAPDRPDAGVICLELLPRYRVDALKDRCSPGDEVTARVRLGNFGLTGLAAGTSVRLEFLEPAPGDAYHFGPAQRVVRTFEAAAPALAPGEEAAVEFRFRYPPSPVWMRVRLDAENGTDEFCEANNQIVERIDARPIRLGYDPKVLEACRAERRINHVGSLSYYDWLRAQKLRMDVMLREAVWPTTTPNGVEEAYRIDDMAALRLDLRQEETPWEKQGPWFDGGFPVNEPVDLMAVDEAIIHEFGHTILSQPDLYGYPMRASNVLLTDDDGKPVAGSPLMPVVAGDDTLPLPPALGIACGGSYTPLMDVCHLWLDAAQAGHIMHYKGYRPDRFWGTQGRLIPTRSNALLVTDLNDEPLRGAAVYVYHVSQAPVTDSGAKFFADRPKFVGNTDDDGRFVFPGETDEDWDDPETDEVDGRVPVWNPFGTAKSDTAFTPNVWEVEGLLLIKVVSGTQPEYHWMDLTQFNEAFLSGYTVSANYPVRTSLKPAPGVTEVVRKPVPEAIRKVNKAPVAVAPAGMTVKCGETFTVDGSKSHDPEGQPLLFRWNVNGDWLRADLAQTATLTQTAPNEPTELEYKLWVLDGVRSSEAVVVKVKVVK
jgi:hypothetical protein